jgi:hypothetical protein
VRFSRKLREAIKSHLPARFYAKWRYPSEYKLYHGVSFGTGSEKSALFFTVHKCASSAMPKIFRYLNQKYLGMRMVNLPAFIYNYTGRDVYAEMEHHESKLFQRFGLLYVPIREYVPIKDIECYTTILMLRDPRDVLVSHYYSASFSHTTPIDRERRKAFLSRRASFARSDVNEFALSHGHEYKTKYLDYLSLLRSVPGTHYLSYEDLVLDSNKWIKGLFGAFGIAPSAKDVEAVKRIARLGSTRKENKYNHIRKAFPGDYKSKLSPETIAQLDREFAEIRMFFFC